MMSYIATSLAMSRKKRRQQRSLKGNNNASKRFLQKSSSNGNKKEIETVVSKEDPKSLEENQDKSKNNENLKKSENTHKCLDISSFLDTNSDKIANMKLTMKSQSSPKRKHNTCDLDSNITPTKKMKTEKFTEQINNKSIIKKRNKNFNFSIMDNVTKTNLIKRKYKNSNKILIKKKTGIEFETNFDILKAPAIVTKQDDIVDHQYLNIPKQNFLIETQQSEDVQLNNSNDVYLSGQNLQNVQQNSNEHSQINSTNQMKNLHFMIKKDLKYPMKESNLMIINYKDSLRKPIIEQIQIWKQNVNSNHCQILPNHQNLTNTNQNMSTSPTQTLKHSNDKNLEQFQNDHRKMLAAQHVPIVNQIMQDTSTTVQELPNLIQNARNTNQKLSNQSTNFNYNLSNVLNLDQLRTDVHNFSQYTSNFTNITSNSGQNLPKSKKRIENAPNAAPKLANPVCYLTPSNQRLPEQMGNVEKQMTIQNAPNSVQNAPNSFQKSPNVIHHFQNLNEKIPHQIGNVPKEREVIQNVPSSFQTSSNSAQNSPHFHQRLPDQIRNDPKQIDFAKNTRFVDSMAEALNYKLEQIYQHFNYPFTPNSFNAISSTLYPRIYRHFNPNVSTSQSNFNQNFNNQNNLEKNAQNSNSSHSHNCMSQQHVRNPNCHQKKFKQTIPHKHELPNVQNVSNITKVPNIPKVSNIPTVSSIPTVPSIPTVANIPTVSNIPNVFNIPTASNISQVPNIPQVSNISQTSNIPHVSNISERVSPYSYYPSSTNSNNLSNNFPQLQHYFDNTHICTCTDHPTPAIFLSQYPVTYQEFMDKMGIVILNIFNHRVIRSALKDLNEKYKITDHIFTITKTIQINNVYNEMINQLYQYFKVFYIKEFNEVHFIQYMKAHFSITYNFQFDAGFVKIFKKILCKGPNYCRYLAQHIDNYLNSSFTDEQLEMLSNQYREYNILIAISMLQAQEATAQRDNIMRKIGKRTHIETDIHATVDSPVEENLDETNQNLLPERHLLSTLVVPEYGEEAQKKHDDENPFLIDENPCLIDNNPRLIDNNPRLIDNKRSVRIDKIVDPKTNEITSELILKSEESEVINNYENGDQNTIIIDIDDPNEEMQYEEGANKMEKFDLTQSSEKYQKRQIIDEFDEDENMLVIDEAANNEEDEENLIFMKDDEVQVPQETLEGPLSDRDNLVEVRFVRDLTSYEEKNNNDDKNRNYC